MMTAIHTPTMIDGYVRLSRDDNKRNYSSIENQKLIIQKYAEENNMIVRHIYEDDGISGYSFNRDGQSWLYRCNRGERPVTYWTAQCESITFS